MTVRIDPPSARWRGDAAALLAGLSLPLAFAPFGAWPLAMISPAVLLGCWRRASPGRAMWRGWLYGAGMFGAGISWIRESFQFAHIGLAVAITLTAGLAALLALYPAVLGALLARMRPRAGGERVWLVLWCPAAWTLAEWLRGRLFTGFTWLDLGYSQIDAPLAGLLPIGGVLAAGFAAVAIGAIGLRAVLGARRELTVASGVIVVILLAGAALRIPQWTAASGAPLDVALVQGNVPQDTKWLPRMRAPTLARYRDLTRANLGADLVVWPESALPGYRAEFTDYLASLDRELDAAGVALVYGVPTLAAPGAPMNSVATAGLARGIYHKRHLVPFGEYLPFAGLIEAPLGAVGIRVANFVPGPARQKPIVAAGAELGTFVCYEIAFGDEVRRALPAASLLLTVSNDAWFGRSIGPLQHMQIARARAVENGRWLLRATNTGVTAVVAPDGTVRARARQFRTTVLRARVTPMGGMTPYARWGDAAIVGFCLAVLASAIAAAWARRRG